MKIRKTLLYIFLIYAILGFIIFPFVLKSQLVEIVQKQSNAKISIDSIYFNPFIFRLKLNSIELEDAENIHLISLKSMTIDIELYSLLNATLHLKNLELEKPNISLVYKKDKSFNIASIIKVKNEKSKPKDDSAIKLPRIKVDRIAIVEGDVNYEDYTHSTKFDFRFNDIGFELKDIDTADLNTSDATLRFYTLLSDGGFFDFKGEVIGFKPFIVKGSLDFEASKLYTQYKYIQDALHLEVADGKINFNAKYYFNLDDLNATSINNLSASITKLRVKPKYKHKDVLNLDKFLVSGVTIKPMQKVVHVSKIELDALDIKVKRDALLKIDWQEYIKTDFKKQTEQKIGENTQVSIPWSVVVDDIALEKIQVNFSDSGVSPSVTTTLNDLNIYLKNTTLEGLEPMSYKMDLRLNEKFVCNFRGDIKHKILDINSYIQCSDLDIVRFSPYIDKMARDALRVYDIKLKHSILGFDAIVSVKELEQEMQVSVSDASINLSKFALDKRSNKERLVDFVDFSVDGLSLNTKNRAVDIKKVVLKDLNIKTALYKDGTLNLENLIVPKEPKKQKTKKIKAKDYVVELKHFALDSAKLSFNDKTLEPSLKTKIDHLNINLYNIDSKAKSWLKYNLSLRLNKKGYAKSKGKVRHTPLRQEGTFDLNKISLKEFSPYIQKNTYMKLNDGYINLKTKIQYAKSKENADLKVNGTFDINKFSLFDERDDSTLLSFDTIALQSFDYEMFPSRAFINELDIDGFYINAIVDENKKMNLASLSKLPPDSNTSKSKDNNATKFPFKIMKLNIKSGNAKFADLSLPLKFKTNIHDLNGVVYSLSSASDEISYVDIIGEVNKYGSTKLIGSIDSSNPKFYTDIDFNFRNLDLNTLSGYSAEFAGYKIDDGKLFLDLGYKIKGSKLLAKNSLIIKKIKLGDSIKDENKTSLPLGLAIALLEDSDKIIDINMPIEGDIDAPNFKYGALVWKTFKNLIVKGVASPFKFLGSMLGINGDDLEFIEFEMGVATLLPPEKEKLDNITKLMIKRPKISLKITPKYDEVGDAWILKQQKLVLLVMKKSGAKNEKEHQNALNIDLLEDIYEELEPKIDVEKIKEKLEKTYKDEALHREYLKALIKELTQMQVLTSDELIALANKRAELLKEYLVNQKGLDARRIKIKATKKVEQVQDKWVRTKLEIDIK